MIDTKTQNVARALYEETVRRTEMRKDLQRLFDDVLNWHMPLVRREQEICDEIFEKWELTQCSTPS